MTWWSFEAQGQLYLHLASTSTQVKCGFIADEKVRIKRFMFFQLCDKFLTEGRFSHSILFWNCLQQLQLVKLWPESLIDMSPSCGYSDSHLCVGCPGRLASTSKESSSDSIHVFNTWWLAAGFLTFTDATFIQMWLTYQVDLPQMLFGISAELWSQILTLMIQKRTHAFGCWDAILD
jgi:hypothetical protein